MAISNWLPALLGYLIPVGLFLLSWGGMPQDRARRTASVGALALSLATLGYFAVGFAFHLGGAHAVAPDQPGLENLDMLCCEGWELIGLKGFFLAGGTGTPEGLALFVLYVPMAATAVLLPVLSASGRARGWQVAVAGLVVAAGLFPVVACWAWGGGWLARLGSPNSMERGHGFIDHSGAGVVYLLGSMVALGALVGMRQRLPRGTPGEPEDMPPAHFPLLANLGTLLLGLGWLGWSLGIPFHVAGAELSLPNIATNGLLAGAGAILTSQLYCWVTLGRADPLMSARGAAVGFVAISAGAPFVPPWSALVVGAVAGALLPLGVYAVERVLRLPDETAAVPLGVIGGLLGLLAVPVFADGRWGQGWNGIGQLEYHLVSNLGVVGFFPSPTFGGIPGDGVGQLLAQLAGTGAILALAFLVGWLLFLVMNLPYRPRRSATNQEVDTVEEAVARSAEEPKRTGDGGHFAPLDVLASHEPELDAGAGGGTLRVDRQGPDQAVDVPEVEPPNDGMGEPRGPGAE
jgi:Amt family ammonium transporter